MLYKNGYKPSIPQPILVPKIFFRLRRAEITTGFQKMNIKLEPPAAAKNLSKKNLEKN